MESSARLPTPEVENGDEGWREQKTADYFGHTLHAAG